MRVFQTTPKSKFFISASVPIAVDLGSMLVLESSSWLVTDDGGSIVSAVLGTTEVVLVSGNFGRNRNIVKAMTNVNKPSTSRS